MQKNQAQLHSGVALDNIKEKTVYYFLLEYSL